MTSDLRRRVRTALRTLLPALLLGLAWAACAAPPEEVRLRVVGGLAGISQYTQHERRFWAQELARLSGGRYSASIMPFNEAGVAPQDMLNLVRLGVVPIGTVALSQAAIENPELGMLDMAGQNPDIDTLRQSLDILRPAMAQILHKRFGAQLLAVYAYPAEMLFCRERLDHLDDLAGRRVRVSTMSQADFMRALKASAVFTEFADTVAEVAAGNADCAVTTAMAGHAAGLDMVTQSLFTLPVSWGVAISVVGDRSWQSYPADLKSMLSEQLPKLENVIWKQSARETEEGVLCSTGVNGCTRKRLGTMQASLPGQVDQARRREVFLRSVLPAWIRRCGPNCAALWQQSFDGLAGWRE